MKDRIQLIEELRILLKDGATPSALIQSIHARIGNTVSYGDLCGILEDAFHLSMVRLSPDSVVPNKDYRGVILNKTLLVEIVQRRSNWDTSHSHELPVKSSWMDGLTLEKPEEVGNKVRSARYPGLSETSWSALSPEVQEALYVQLASSIVISQRVEVLSKLAERLQEKLNERNDTNGH
jgi:hypothetical protein